MPYSHIREILVEELFLDGNKTVIWKLLGLVTSP